MFYLLVYSPGGHKESSWAVMEPRVNSGTPVWMQGSKYLGYLPVSSQAHQQGVVLEVDVGCQYCIVVVPATEFVHTDSNIAHEAINNPCFLSEFALHI